MPNESHAIVRETARGAFPPDKERRFQEWYREHAARWKVNPDPDAPGHFYDYREAYDAGAAPSPEDGHWPSEFKLAGHPNRYVDGIDTITGEPADRSILARAFEMLGTPRVPERATTEGAQFAKESAEETMRYFGIGAVPAGEPNILAEIAKGAGKEVDREVEMLGEARDFGGAFAQGLLEGAREGGIEDTAGLAARVAHGAFRAITPGTSENVAVGGGLEYLASEMRSPLRAAAFAARVGPQAGKMAVQYAKSELERIGRAFKDPVGSAREDPIGTLDAFVIAGAPWQMALRRALTRAGVDITTDAFALAGREISSGIGEKAVALQKRMAKSGIAMTEDEAIEAVIASDPTVHILRRDPFAPPRPIRQPAPMPHGEEAVFINEAGEKGQMAYAEKLYHSNVEAYINRVVPEVNRKRFAGLSKEEKSALSVVAGRMDIVDGKERFGGILRYGEISAEDALERGRLGKGGAHPQDPVGRILPQNGTVVGPEVSPGQHQVYKIVTEDQGKAVYDLFKKKYPRALPILDAFLAEKEAPIITFQGLRLPAFSRKRLKEGIPTFIGGKVRPIKGLEKEEAESAAALFRMAYGKDAFPESQLWQFNWSPQSVMHGNGLGTRFRNQLRHWSAPQRRRRRGWVERTIDELGEGVDFERGLSEAQVALATEPIRESLTNKLLSLLAEPLTEADRYLLKQANYAEDALEGYSVFSGTGLYKASGKFKRYLERNRDWFTEQGIDVPETLTAATLAGGKGHKIPSLLAARLGAWYEPKLASTIPGKTRRLEKIDKVFGDLIRAPLTWFLSRPSTANRNAVSQAWTFAPKILRDFYRGIYQMIPAARFEELPWKQLTSDFVGIGRGLSRRGVREMPPELGSSNYLQMLERGPISKASAVPLRIWLFNFWDTASKRVVKETVYDGLAKNDWARAVRFKRTGGIGKEEFIRRWRANVRPEAEALAMREMDTWGAFNYDSVHDWIEFTRRSNVMHGLIPYPTWKYKEIGNLYTELGLTPWGFYRNAKTAGEFGASRLFGAPTSVTKDQAVNALANLSAGATMAYVAFNVADEIGNLAEKISNEQTRAHVLKVRGLTGRELSETELYPATERKFGRKEIPLPDWFRRRAQLAEDESLWVRMLDWPFVGPAMFYKAAKGGHATYGDYLNDTLSTGPLYDVIAIAGGLSNDYNRYKSKATRLGELLADVTPGTNEWRLVRQLTDEIRRDTREETLTASGRSGFWPQFYAGLADRMPGLSVGLPPRAGLEGEIRTYNPAETLGAYFVMNIRKLSEKEYEAAISALALESMTEHNAAIDREIVTEHVLKLMDANGQTVAGKAIKDVRRSAPEIQREIRMQLNRALIVQAFKQEGEKAAIKKARELMKGEKDVGVFDSAIYTLQKFSALDRKGLEGLILFKAGKRRGALVKKRISELEEQ